MSYQKEIEAAARYLQEGDVKKAQKHALIAAKLAPTSPVAPNIAGIALSQSGKPREALVQFQKALKLKPDDHDALLNFVQTQILLGQAAAALPAATRLSVTTPGDWQVWYLKAQAHQALGEDGKALDAADTAAALAPQAGAVEHLRSNLLMGMGRIKDAIAALERALAINPADTKALRNLSLPLARQTRTEEALEVVERAVALDAGDLAARFRLATQLIEMGRTQDGIAAYREILARDPKHSVTLERLAQLLSGEALLALDTQVDSALKTAPKNSEDRASLFFAKARIAEASGNPGAAERALELANRDMMRVLPYDAGRDAAVTNAILKRFPTEIAATGAGDTATRPIFILGLPRSGTTLAEAILGRHPQVAPLGELGTIGFLLRDIIEQDLPFGPEEVAALVAEDQRLLPDLPEGTRAYTDKMPENYRLVGFLKTAYPDARIIHVRRDPRDIALSMWRSHFSGTVLSYSYDLSAMAAKFNLYAESMAHWHRVLPGQILDVRYEDIVQDVERTGQRMADFCGLDWQPQMTRPDQGSAQVMTLSATQLRQPVHSQSVGKWRDHQALLAPFLKGLNPAYWPDLRFE